MLIAGVATGQNPRTIAGQIRQALGGKLVRALRISRTEVLRSYRQSSRRSYQANSDVVKGWVWHSALGTRTCAACWTMHGTVHRLDERLDDHVQGRCSAIPVTKSWAKLGFANVAEPRPSIPKGVDLFEQLSDADKEKVLGKAAFHAYQAGAVKLQDFVGRKRSTTWGTMRCTRSLRDILGPDEARKWIAEAVKAKRMKDEPNRLIREWLNPKRLPTEAEIKRVLDHVARAPFSTRPVAVDKSIRGQVFQGRKLGDREPSIIAHFAKRVLINRQWIEDVAAAEFVDHLNSAFLEQSAKERCMLDTTRGFTLVSWRLTLFPLIDWVLTPSLSYGWFTRQIMVQ